MKLLFGTGGSPHSSRGKTTVDGIRRIRELGLDCMELEFVHGVQMGEATAQEVRAAAESENVTLTVHAPYYINLNAVEMEKVTASQTRLLQTARIGGMCGVKSAAFHAAFYLKATPDEAYTNVKKYLGEVTETLQRENNGVTMRPEVMGRNTQFGTIDEIVRLSAELPQVAPCVDFSHWHARNGLNNTYAEFSAVIEQIQKTLGKPAIENLHMHFSGIVYGKKGEIEHTNLQESDMNYRDFLRALKDYGVGGYLICESQNLEADALLLKETYSGLPSV